ncbi:MAG: histidinol dehydrogenase [Aquimonas sp.]|nr:histidinol dehydrogenase [Aquimonas sp.]
MLDWNGLDDAQRRMTLRRPAQGARAVLAENVERIISQVRADGDSTLRALTRRFDGCELASFRVTEDEFETAEAQVAPALKQAIANAIGRLIKFHEAGAPRGYALETEPGLNCERVIRPIERVGLYVPAGSAPLPSTAIMLGVPARIAGCAEVVLCTPPKPDGSVDATVLVAARLCGISTVFKLGGAQAIAAMAYGTETVPKCDKLFGPGNAFVTEAKMQVANDPDGAAIDMPAGPSEVLVIADANASPEFIASDLLSQAEHGPDSQVLLISDSQALLESVAVELEKQTAELPRREILAKALTHARLILSRDIPQAIEISNRYAPEHLILQVEQPRQWLERVRSAGSIFLGALAPEALGDYCSGTNHVLPTYGAARAYSGVSVTSFVKLITVQEVSAEGLNIAGPDAAEMARAEGLIAHERAVTRRLAAIAEGRA